MQQPLISVVVPAYNEERTIGNTISKTISAMESLKLPYEIIVVDDGSNDNTKRIAAEYKATLLTNGKNHGKGHALRRGFQFAQGDIIITIDSDGTHDPKEIPDLIHPLFNGVDITAGSRFLGNGKKDYTKKLHLLGNHIFNTLILLLTRKQITDSQTGFRAFKKEVLKRLNLNSLGYDIETELTIKGLKNGFTYQETPITCRKREHSHSKLRTLPDGYKILKAIFTARFT